MSGEIDGDLSAGLSVGLSAGVAASKMVSTDALRDSSLTKTANNRKDIDNVKDR